MQRKCLKKQIGESGNPTLATWEAEIRRITVQGQPRQIVHKTPSQQKKKLGMVVSTCHPSYGGKPKI
jgi:hypothetical protein